MDKLALLFLVAGKARAKANADAAASVVRRRAQIAGNDAFYLRTKVVGYDWVNPDPDRLLPNA
jgi:hypothetical protein